MNSLGTIGSISAITLAIRELSASKAPIILTGLAIMNDSTIDMRLFAKKAGTSMNYAAGGFVFNKGDPGECMYVVQSGEIEMVIGDRVVEVCGPNEAIGFMSVIDDAPRSSTARVKEACEVSVIDRRKFRFMIDEVPNFALYIMGAMARRIRGMGQAM
jgi:CRP/FNR family cyclic AMP-dependent transcriptional regulator